MNWLRRLMYGRYGFDALSNFILIAGVVIYFIFAVFPKTSRNGMPKTKNSRPFSGPPQPSSESEKGCGRTGKATNIISAQNAGSIFALQKEKVRSN